MAELDPRSGGGGDEEVSDPSDFDDDFLSSFLSDSSTPDSLSFALASGINVGSVARGVAGSIIFALALGVNTVVDGISNAVTTVIDAGQAFIAGPYGLIERLVGPGTAAIRGAWAFSLSEYGVLAYPLALVVLLSTMYIAERGVNYVREVLA